MAYYLSNKTENRDNNFHLLRIIAAILVLIGHSYDLTRSSPDIISNIIGTGIASLGVDIFFVASGFLITQSFIGLKNPSQFVLNRILRIYPALIICCILTVFCLGPIFTVLPLNEYFMNFEVYGFLYSKSSIIGVLISGGGSYLPGVFKENPFPGTVNGSLWTLVYEIFMYLLVFSTGTLSITILKKVKDSLLYLYIMIICSCLLLQYYIPTTNETLAEILRSISRFGICFFCGGLLYLLKKYIVISKPFFILSLLCILSKKVSIFNCYFGFVYYFGVAYLVIYFAYHKKLLKNLFFETNDYSYGIYIYAFPLQQSVIYLIPQSSPIDVIVLAGVPTLIMAILSWHLVEQKFLKMKNSVLTNQKAIETMKAA